MEKWKVVAQSSGIDIHKNIDVDEEYFDGGEDDMVGTISIILTEYLGECEVNPDEDYDQEDEETFTFFRIEDEPGFFPHPTERQMSHLRPLQIVAVVNGFKINKVLIDDGVAISLLLEMMLGKYFAKLVPTNIAVIDFSGNYTPAKGLVTLTVKVGSSERHSVFVVVPSKASYNALLGRDWIHGVGAVPSIVHQSVLLWTKEGKPEIVKAYSSLYVEQMHVNFRIYNRKLKPLNVDRSLNPYNCEGCYLTSEELSVKLRYPDIPFEPTENKDDSSNKVESDMISKSTNCSMFVSTPLVECSYDFSITCNEVNDVSRTADLIAEAHCVKNKCSNELINDQVSSISDFINFTFDCIYDLEPLRFEKYSVEDDHYKGFESQDPLEEINLGTHDDVRITYVCKNLVDPFRIELFDFLHEFKDCFAWDYHEMPGLDRSLVEHRLTLKPNARPVKQTPRRFAPEINVKIKKIECLIKAKFIRTARYVEWVSNIVPVMKKNRKLRVCIDFQDLNNATLRDEYFMPIVDMLIDSAAGNEMLSFMDSYSGYNQIFIAEDDVAKTAFRCPGALGMYEWVVMPFGLKNAGATYQRAMNAIFHEFIGKFMEVYIDDVMVKLIPVSQHIDHLRKAFLTMRKKGLKMNPLKCAFGVSDGNFLGFVVIDKNKADAILALSAPKSKKEVQSFLGKINYLRRFILNLSDRTRVFAPLIKLKNGSKLKWTTEHQLAFDSIKTYLSKAPIMANVHPFRPLKLYIAASEDTIGCMLAQDGEDGHERAVYYLSRVLTDIEMRYSPIKKLCLSLYHACMMLKCYMVAKSVKVIAQTDVIKYMLSFPMLRGHLGKWMLALTEFDL
ncbi:uncharacterized protein LOC107478145 [Arachis duranensis]|uniref:Uncharacterized protein LOC107478145 n=1 Tax=Arachis duranensis TaxID=130453 RepID=A0A6P4CM37_ARADU|nr:uncharacterized protein LOC107478145 [Arachis duranensis]